MRWFHLQSQYFCAIALLQTPRPAQGTHVPACYSRCRSSRCRPAWSPWHPQCAIWHLGSARHGAGNNPNQPHAQPDTTPAPLPTAQRRVLMVWASAATYRRGAKRHHTWYSPAYPTLLQTDEAPLQRGNHCSLGRLQLFTALSALSLQRLAQPPRHRSPFHRCFSFGHLLTSRKWISISLAN